MAKDLMPRLAAHCQNERAALFVKSLEFAVYCHYCHDIFNLIKKSIEINNKLKKCWQSWRALAKLKFWLMGIEFNFLSVVGRPPN